NRDAESLQADPREIARRVEFNIRVFCSRPTGKPYNVHFIPAGVGQGLAHLFEHARIIDRLKYRNDDYFPFFYYLRQVLSEVIKQSKLITNIGITANHRARLGRPGIVEGDRSTKRHPRRRREAGFGKGSCGGTCRRRLESERMDKKGCNPLLSHTADGDHRGGAVRVSR